jgi:hypothetical protein
MKHERYDVVESSTDKLEFTFFSEGPKGKIAKVIQFSKIMNIDAYNLSFGNYNKDGSIDDETTNDNKDRNKILATVAIAISEFTALYPDKLVFFCGSTPERTRLYRMALTINMKELEKDFHIYGVFKGINIFTRVPFIKGVDYYGFMIKRKKVNLPYEKK